MLTAEAFSRQAGVESAASIRGIAFALCCRHMCSWESYVGRDWLMSCGFSEDQFRALCYYSKLASKYEVSSLSTDAARLAAARAELGILSKRLLDEGRCAWLRSHGWSARLLHFVSREI